MRAQVARDIYVGYMLIYNASEHHFSELKYGLHQDFLTGSNNFPDNAEDALRLLSNFTPKKGKIIITLVATTIHLAMVRPRRQLQVTASPNQQ